MDSKIFDISFLKGLVYVRIFVILFVLFFGFYFVGSTTNFGPLLAIKKSMADSIGLANLSEWNFDHLSSMAKPLLFSLMIQLFYLFFIGKKKYDILMVIVIIDFVFMISSQKLPFAPILIFILLLSDSVKNYFQGMTNSLSDDNILDDF